MAVGYGAARYVIPSDAVSANTIVGTQAGQGGSGVTTYKYTSAFGYRALINATTGGSNVAVGSNSMYYTSSGSSNVAVGHQSMYHTQTGSSNVMVGFSAGQGVSGNSYSFNVGVGNGALSSLYTGANNVAVGYRALLSNQTGANNVAIGHQSGYSLTSGSNNVFIGSNAGYQVTTASHRLYIDNTNTTTPLIYGEFDNDILRVNGELQVGDPSTTGFKFPTSDGSANYVLKTDGSGSVTWAEVSGTGGLGAVGAVGTPINNQIAIWTDAKNIEGDGNLTFDGSLLQVRGSFRSDTIEVNGRPPASPSAGEVGAGGKIITQFHTQGTVAAGKLYVGGSTAWVEADADAGSTSAGLLAVATDDASPASMLLEGSVKMLSNQGFSSASKGDVLYISQTAGEVTDDISAYTTGDFVRICGYVLDANKNYIFFKPDNTWLEL